SDPSNYFGMAGVKIGTIGTVLVLIRDGGDGVASGFWLCEGANTNTGCNIQSTYITLPSSFCSFEPEGFCYPDGVALDKKLNLYYADPLNNHVVKCTFASAYSTCLIPLGSIPEATGLFRDANGTLWTTGGGCNGDIYKDGTFTKS